ncbi:monoheme cytochrome C [Sungkyunkwania multivorans]|uniref:Monoheme cytochrome C n=1 Tax=Sungkyunkwania multivorans TaxID=1173618 RepID=A0ABW3CZE3_9FLAO
MDKHEEFRKSVRQIRRLFVLLFTVFGLISGGVLYLMMDPDLSIFKKTSSDPTFVVIPEEDEDRIENGIHVRTGLKDAEGLMVVVYNCTNCHSAKLVTQNRMNKERWAATIDWMQETQNLWDLGSNEEVIINYLVTNYPPREKGRRERLINIAWYDLEQ